jgi:hypothetical protein
MGFAPFEKLLQSGSIKTLDVLLSKERVWAHREADSIRRAKIETVPLIRPGGLSRSGA